MIEQPFVALLLVIASYLVGSIPTAYYISRRVAGIDLRDYGSGTVSGSMVFEHVGRLAVIPVGLFDISKGALTTWVALALGFGETVAIIVGLASVIGHNWPIFLHFHGGRGWGAIFGMWLVLYPPAALWIGAAMVVGFLLGDSAPFAVVILMFVPVFANQTSAPEYVAPLALAMLLIILLKRIEANRRPLPEDRDERIKVLLLRAIFDRDIRSHEEWIRREPDTDPAEFEPQEGRNSHAT